MGETDLGDDDKFTAFPDMKKSSKETIRAILDAKIEEAKANGIDGDDLTRLREILDRFVDVFRVEFGHDPPVKIKPMMVRMRSR